MNELLGDLIGVSDTSVSLIFNTWISFMSLELCSSIFWPKKESGIKNVPSSMQRYRHLCCILDCTKLKIWKPRDLQVQVLTWSDFKRQNTIKYHVGISPNSAITFLSSAC